MRCTSCNDRLSQHEMLREIILEDGSKAPETFCRACLTKYVAHVDDLDYREYAFEHKTEHINNHFTIYRE